MTYCEGKNCDKKEYCQRYVNTAVPSVIEQITDFSTSGSGTANTSGINVAPYCGIGSMYDYFIPNENSDTTKTNVIIDPPISLWDYNKKVESEDKKSNINESDKPVVITVPEKYVSKIKNWWGNSIDSDNIGEFSDGYHTFNELYHHRAILFSVICNKFKKLAWKSLKHSDNDEPMYDGMFIVGINTPQGPASYHYNIEPYWDLFDCEELPKAPEWDLHTPDDAIKRIYSLIENDKPLITIDMMNLANKNGLTYYYQDLRYSYRNGFHDKYGIAWSGEAFKSLNDLLYINGWKILYNEN